MQPFSTDLSFAKSCDQQDPLATYRDRFHFPLKDEKPVIYFCGNSLGLQGKAVQAAVQTELDSWRDLAIDGFRRGPHPWLYYQEYLTPAMARIVGAEPHEVTIMNTLTVNLHLLLLSFYRPTATRNLILMEKGAFPSDQYAVETLVRHYGLSPDAIIVEVEPAEGEFCIQPDALLEKIHELGDRLAMVMIGGIQYYTGQFFPIASITAAAHAVGAIAGFDLAHAVGNVPLSLHDWNVDFAAWCTYKYLNGGPGAVGGLYVHDRYARDTNHPRLGGWWGNDEKTRFRMEKGFIPKPTAGGWNISTAQVLNMCALKSSIEIFDEVGMDAIRKKSQQLTGYLSYLLQQPGTWDGIQITPDDPEQRGAQLSLYFRENGPTTFEQLTARNVVVDYREPGVIRIAPAPLYCSFEDVHTFYSIVKNS
jgi:kynureninase